MSKYHRINWRDSDTKEINRVVKNFNAKINRLIKKNPQMANVLPEKVSAGQLRELINTRRDLNRELNSLRRFSRRGAEELVEISENDYNLRTTKWQRTEMNRRVVIINQRRAKRLDELSNLEVTSRGESLGYKRSDIGMGKATEVSLSPMHAFTRRMSQRDLKMKWKAIMKESQSDYFTQKDFRLRENYIKALEQNFNADDISDIIKEIRSIDINDFLLKFEEEGGTLELAYPPNKEQYQGYVNALRSTWIPER